MPSTSRLWSPRAKRIALWSAAGVGGAIAAGLLAIGVALVLIAPQLPDVSSLANYQPKLPLRVYTADGALIGEFGEERRELVPIDKIPRVLKDAVLATEDARFYQHGGIDTKGVLRAVFANLSGGRAQGASTITQQVARNMFLTSERTVSRKLKEAILAWRLEDKLTKDQILEIYLNQIYLGNRAYGFAAAAQTYFGKPLDQITAAEAAMLAGLPKAPGTNNPVANPRRAVARQQYVIQRMVETGYLKPADAEAARAEPLKLREANDPTRVHAEYVAEMVRQQMVDKFGDAAYTRGLNVTTTLTAADQNAAYAALRAGLLDYEQRQPYRGPEGLVADLPTEPKALDQAIDEALADHPDNGELVAAVVLEAGPKKITAVRANGDTVEITGRGLQLAQRALNDKAQAPVRIQRGAIIRLEPNGKTWEVAQLPEVEGAFVSLDPRDGSVKALVGGFDFNKNKFNHVTQAWRQPGSSFKPFIYSAALEKGFMPSTVVNDGPLFFDAGTTGGQPWEPKNYDGTFEGPMSLRRALMKSKNMVSIRILQSIGTRYAQDWIGNFGFEREKHPAYLPMALGAGSVTPMQMATAYSVFANGGYRVNPYLITKITDHKDKVLVDVQPPLLNESMRAIPQRNAFIMDSLLQSVASGGTAAKAQATLKRTDLYGKTGTTNDSLDAWFAGFQPTIAAVVWMGYDTPRKLGDRETGGGLSLPIWISFMQTALKGVPVAELPPPPGVVQVGGEWYFDDYTPGRAVSTLGVEAAAPATADPNAAPAGGGGGTEERNRILDMFRN